MKTKTVTTYTASELKEQFPDAFEHALSEWQNRSEPAAWSDEIFDSLKAVCKAADVKLKDWDLGAYNRGNHIDIELPGDDATAELSGKRAMAWLENNLFGPLRVRPNLRIDDWRKHVDPATGFLKHNAPLDELSRYYRTLDGKLHLRGGAIGQVPPCPLTGVCFDEDYLDALRKAIRDGETLQEAFKGLADVYERLVEAEIESQNTEEYFIEHAETNDWQFTEDGELE